MIHVRVEQITTKFGDLLANDSVDLSVHRGTVHAILGENGAGKTTLMNVLYGLCQPDEGRIEIAGKDVLISSPRTAHKLGIGMIHQHFSLVKALSVTENIVLGLAGSKFFLNFNEHSKRIAELCDSFGFDVDPDALVWKLPIGMQQRVEILKVLYRDADILILDEPTSILAPQEVEALFSVLRKLKASGKTILFITHKLAEVMNIADRISVMRRGKIVEDIPVSEATPSELARQMTGRLISTGVSQSGQSVGDVVLKADKLVASNDRGRVALHEVSIELHRGEILGIAGVNGNGQSELAEVLAGLRRLDSGHIFIDGINVSAESGRTRKHERGVGYVPSDRQGVSLLLDQSVAFNCVLRNFDRFPFSKRGFLDFSQIDKHTRRVVEEYDVRLHDIHQKTRSLSGGNQQKLVVGRELADSPGILVADQPCQGLDVGAVEFVHQSLALQRSRGVGVLYISTELEDLLSTCDRVAVMYRGRINGILSSDDATTERIGRLMVGLEDTGE